MSETARLLPICLASSLLGSCGTLLSRQDGIESEDARIYGGVAREWSILGKVVGVNVEEPGSQDAGMGCLVALYVIIDLPFSLVADTLMLPLTIPEALTHDEELAAFRALLVAVEKGDVEAARRVVDQEPDTVEFWNDKGDTALDVAARSGRLPMVELLVAAGADVRFRDGQPLQSALFAGQHGVAVWMHDHGITAEDVRATLERALHADRADVAAFVFGQHWYPPEGVVRWDQPLLQLAARQGKVDLMRVTLDSGANVNRADENGFTALHAAVWGEKPEAVRLLLARGADVAARYHERTSWFTSRELTPLDSAEIFHLEEIARLLRAAGAREPR